MHFYFEAISSKDFMYFAFIHFLLFLSYGWQWNVKEQTIQKRGDNLLFNLMQEEVSDFLKNENKAFLKWYIVPLSYLIILLIYVFKLPHKTFSPIIILLIIYFLIHSFTNFNFIYKIVEQIKEGKVKDLEEAINYIEDTKISSIVLKNKKIDKINNFIKQNNLSLVEKIEDDILVYKSPDNEIYEIMPTYDNRYTLFSIKRGTSSKFLSIFKEIRLPVLDLLEAFIVSFLILMSLIIQKG